MARMTGLATVLALACGGCGDDDPGGTTGAIELRVDPAQRTVTQGGSGSVTVSLTRAGGFSGVVALAVTGLPAGITTTITPAQLSGTTASATVDVTVATTVALGTYAATVTGTAQGVGEATATYQLTVTATPDYALTVAPAALTIVAGTGAGTTVSIDRTNFTAGVAFALLNPPAGIVGAFNPTPSTTNASALQVSVAANVAPGNYPLTIQGTATGPGTRTTTLAVTVPAPPTGGNVEYLFCSPSDVPAFLAFQDGSGPWNAVAGTASGGATRFAFVLTQGHGGVLAVYQTAASAVVPTAGRLSNVRPGAMHRAFLPSELRVRSGVTADRSVRLGRSSFADVYQTYVLFGSTAELRQDGLDACAQTPPTGTVTGTVSGVPAGGFGIVSIGSTTEVFEGGTSTNPVTFTDVPAGPVDLVATRMATPGTPPDRAVVFRSLNPADGASLPSAIDFNGPASSVPATAIATILGGAGDDLEIFTELVTANGATLMWFDLAPSPSTPRPWAGLGPASMVSGDYHGLVVFATATDGSGDYRVSLKYVGPVANHDLVLGSDLSEPTISQVVAGSYPRFRFHGTLPAEYDKGASIDVLGPNGPGNLYSILATSAYLSALGDATTYDFTMPDVSGLAGFPLAARLTAGVNDVAASAFGFVGTGILELRPSPGSEAKAAVKNATFTVP